MFNTLVDKTFTFRMAHRGSNTTVAYVKFCDKKFSNVNIQAICLQSKDDVKTYLSIIEEVYKLIGEDD